MIGINNCDKCCNMQQAGNVDRSKDNLESQSGHNLPVPAGHVSP